jgi:hypothetical protein
MWLLRMQNIYPTWPTREQEADKRTKLQVESFIATSFLIPSNLSDNAPTKDAIRVHYENRRMAKYYSAIFFCLKLHF